MTYRSPHNLTIFTDICLKSGRWVEVPCYVISIGGATMEIVNPRGMAYLFRDRRGKKGHRRRPELDWRDT